jgi:ubiquinone/menaquinone biosynthesis C-methylase UbiE
MVAVILPWVAALLASLPASSSFVRDGGISRTPSSRVVVSVLQQSSSSSAAAVVTATTTSAAAAESEEELALQKKKLLELLRTSPYEDGVLADPITKEPVTIATKSTVLLGGQSSGRATYEIKSPSNTFSGSSDTYIDLLEPEKDSTDEPSSQTENRSSALSSRLVRNLVPLIPPPLRSPLATVGLLPASEEYVPMRDLFTSPSVSFAYERGWRQGFAQAGFPGPDREAAMAAEYFEPAVASSPTRVLVDMSCATGLFARRFAASGRYRRVLGCDYSASMLREARRRIRRDPELMPRSSGGGKQDATTRLDLVRLDVGQIPMLDGSVDALHAGAAMHCWPDLPAAAREIHRVLKPGGRYFATTFLSSYFGVLRRSEGGATGPSRQAFQYFASVEQLRSLLEEGGFKKENILIEVLGSSCVVIRAEKEK